MLPFYTLNRWLTYVRRKVDGVGDDAAARAFVYIYK